MAATVQFVHPSEWDGSPPTDGNGWRRVVVWLTGSDIASEETNVRKVDVSELRCSNGNPVMRTVVESIEYQVASLDGTPEVLLHWDHSTDVTIARLAGSGRFDFERFGGLVDPSTAEDGTGDILLTTQQFSAADSYSILLSLRLKDD